jgi:hypothetical protein
MTTLLFLYIGFGALLAGISIPLILRKIPPNPIYGFRVPRTLNNPAIWYDANAYAGVRMLVFGLVLIVAAVGLYAVPGLGVDTYAWSVLAVVVVGLAVVVFQSFRYLRRLPG